MPKQASGKDTANAFKVRIGPDTQEVLRLVREKTERSYDELFMLFFQVMIDTGMIPEKSVNEILKKLPKEGETPLLHQRETSPVPTFRGPLSQLLGELEDTQVQLDENIDNLNAEIIVLTSALENILPEGEEPA
jgi:hypothetical protein